MDTTPAMLRAPSPVATLCATTDRWWTSHSQALSDAGYISEFVRDGSSLAARLASDWSIRHVILDMALATPSLIARFGPSGPQIVAFGSPENAGIVLTGHDVAFVEEDDLAGLLEALGAAPPADGLADLSDRTSARQGALGAEAARVAAALARLARPSMTTQPAVVATVVRDVIRSRRGRDRFFPAEIFGDPAWDMLLDLFAAQIEQSSVSVTSLCIAAAVPSSTALRWIRNLCDAGLFVREADPSDARRAFVSLSPDSAAAMHAYFGAIGVGAPI